MASHPNNHWDASTFHFNSPNQSVDWKAFYTRALDYLDALDIKTDEADDCNKCWKQLRLMFEGDDRQDLQSLTDNGTIMEESMKMPQCTLDAIRMTIKCEEHFWAIWDELVSNVEQLPDEDIHVLSTHICNPVSQCTFPITQMQKYLNHGPATCSAIPWGQRLVLPTGLVQAHLPIPAIPVQTDWILVQAVSKGKRVGASDHASINTVTSSVSSIFHPHWCSNN